MGVKRIFTFHQGEVGVSEGNIMSVNSYEKYTIIDISTDATSLTVRFEAQGDNDNWVPVKATNLKNELKQTEVEVGTNELWQVETFNFKRFRVAILTQIGGTGTTIKGRVVDRYV